jgi:hypothetical protein
MKNNTYYPLSSIIYFTLFGQNITGKWYEIQDPNASLEFTIDKTNDAYSGIYNWERKDQTSTITPIESVTVKNDF